MTTDKITQSWIRNRSDEIAVELGCRFDEHRAAHVLWFFENCLELYEGVKQPFVPIPAAQQMLSRVFGWVRWSDKHQRWVRRFKTAQWWVGKKNAKSPIAAGVGLYLLTMDGEDGQKVYTAARDGGQAKIVHRHAIKMGQRSPILKQYLKFNKTTNTIEYPDTDSYYFLICGDNVNSQEGLNGSCIIDELHVVDSELYSTLEYMGASRAEPLMFMVSTAGKDLTSIGKYLYDYGKQVEKGEARDITTFFEAFELPEKISDEQLKLPDDITAEEEAERLKPWIAANPGWGITVDTEDFIAKLKAAQRSPAKFSRFKMYRGNQWQSGDSPFIDGDDWDACRVEYDDEEFIGRPCYGGIDLALMWDLSAFVLLFPWGRTKDNRRLMQYRVRPFFFLPEEGFLQLAQKVPSLIDWRDRGFLTVTPGNTFDEETYRECVLEQRDKYDLRGVAYDPRYAHSLAQTLQDGHGIAVEKFNQSGITFAGPVDEMEKAICGHVLGHDGNPVLTWNSQNVTVIERPGNLKLLAKPIRGNHKKIDGIVAATMALAMSLSKPEVTSIYEEEGALFG